MTTLSVTSLIVAQTKAKILELGLSVARLVGLPVDTWRVGDPTRTLYQWQAEQLEALELVQTEYAKAGFLDSAEGDWLKLRASDVYGVEAEEASFSTPTITLANESGGFYEIEPGGLIVRSADSTFTNQATVTIETGPAFTVEVLLVAQVAGAAGTVSADDIDTIVSPTLEGVSIASSTAATGSDAQSDASVREQCRATLGALSPNGPADAYEYVARSSALTGVVGVTRAQSDGDSVDGTVTVYVAGATAGLDAPSVAAIQAAVDIWAQPLCTDATVVSATPRNLAPKYALDPHHPEKEAEFEAAVRTYFASVGVGGFVAETALISIAHVVCGPTLIRAFLLSPSADVQLAAGEFPVATQVTINEYVE